MASNALNEWSTWSLQRLAELEHVHATHTGTGPGRKWGTTQLNRSLFVVLSAQFQSYCRDLHNDAVQVQVDTAVPAQRTMLKLLLTQGRKLETGNARRSAIGSDFVRLGFDFVGDLKAKGPATIQRLDRLEVLLDYRNAIGPGDESKITAIEDDGEIAATKASYLKYRQAINALAGTMDAVAAVRLSQVLGIGRPW